MIHVKTDKSRIVLLGILFFGLIARLVKFTEPIVGTDVVAFSRLGRNLVENGSYYFGENYNMGVFFPPGYSILVGVMNLFVDDLFVSAKLVSVIASLVTIVLSYYIGKELYGREAGLFSALIFASYPLILIISLQAWSDALFYSFLLLSLYIFILALKRKGLFLYALFGFSAAISYLTRPEGMFLLLLLVPYLLGTFDDKPRFDKRRLAVFIMTVAVFAVAVSPYIFFLKDYTGRYVLSGKNNISILLGELSGDHSYHEIVNAPDNLYDRAAFSLNEGRDRLIGWDKDANLSLKDYLFKDPLEFVDRYIKNVMQEVKLLIKLILPLMIPFFFFFFDRRLFRNKMNLIFIMFPLLYFLIYPLFIIIEKQTLLIIVFAAFPISYGFSISRDAVSGICSYYGLGGYKAATLLQGGIKLIIVLLLLLSSLSYLKYSSIDKASQATEYKRAGDYLRQEVSSEYEKLNIMSRKPLVSFYSDARFTMLPYADATDVINFARRYNVDYIAIDERLLSKWDHYDQLVRLDRFSPDVEMVFEDTSDKLIRLFKIRE